MPAKKVMAMYENLGYCPSNEFFYYSGVRAEEVIDIIEALGDRRGYLVYSKYGCAWGCKNSSVVDAILGNPKGLGRDIVSHLGYLIPECVYAQKGKKILITDVVNPHLISDKIFEAEDNGKRIWGFCDENGMGNIREPLQITGGKRLFYDERFLCVIEDQESQVQIWLFRFPQ